MTYRHIHSDKPTNRNDNLNTTQLKSNTSFFTFFEGQLKEHGINRKKRAVDNYTYHYYLILTFDTIGYRLFDTFVHDIGEVCDYIKRQFNWTCDIVDHLPLYDGGMIKINVTYSSEKQLLRHIKRVMSEAIKHTKQATHNELSHIKEPLPSVIFIERIPGRTKPKP